MFKKSKASLRITAIYFGLQVIELVEFAIKIDLKLCARFKITNLFEHTKRFISLFTD